MVLGAKPPRRQRQQQLACGVALEELSLDQPRRYQAELTSRGGLLVVPGNSGLEISAGQMGRPDPRDQGLAADIVTVVVIIINRCESEYQQVLRAGSYRLLELGHTRVSTLSSYEGH